MESEAAYFHRRVSEERERLLIPANQSALVQQRIVEDLESLARALEAKQRRDLFHDVNRVKGD